MQGTQGSDPTPAGATYATLGNLSTDQHSGGQQSNGKKPCICGGQHRYADCFYIIDGKAPQGWKPQPPIVAKINEKCRDLNLLAKINKIWGEANLPKWGADAAQQQTPNAAGQSANMVDTSIHGVYSISAAVPKEVSPELQNSFILDSGATTHVCNDRSRFIEFTKDKQWLAHGNSGMWTSGQGKVILRMQTPNSLGIHMICLGDVVYCPDFHLSIVSFSWFCERGIYWNTEQGILYWGSEDLARVKWRGNLFIIEDKEVSRLQVNANMKTSSKPLISEASADTWHRCLGHIYHGSMAKLPYMVDGVAISGAQSHETPCLTCEVAKAQSQISRRPAKHAKQPGECIHMDLIDNTIGYNGN